MSAGANVVSAIDRVHGEGAFDVLDKVVAMRARGIPVISLGIGQPDFDPPQHVVEAARHALETGPHGYTPTLGMLETRRAVVSHVARRDGIDVSPERVAIMPGGKPTIFLAVALFGEPGIEILHPDPGFPPYRSAIGYTGATAVGYPSDEARGFAIDPEAILRRITPRTRLVIVNFPSNPTGGGAGRDDLAALAEGLSAFPEVTLLSDEIYSGLSFDGPHASFIEFEELHDRLIVLDGWSKNYAMTGWRVGYGIWPEALLDPLRRMVMITHSCVNVSAQAGAMAALEGPQDHLEAMRQTFARRRDYVVDALNSIPGFMCPKPSGAFYAFPSIAGTGLDDEALADRLLDEAHVAVIPGSDFGVNGAGHLRFSYASSMKDLTEAFDRIRTVVGV